MKPALRIAINAARRIRGGAAVLGMTAMVCASSISNSNAGPIPDGKPSSYPGWWFDRDVIPRLDSGNTSPEWPVDYRPVDDFTLVNSGQLKNAAKGAYQEMRAKLPAFVWSTERGAALKALVTGWNPAADDNFAAVNTGQVKALLIRFYDTLALVKYRAGHSFPPAYWSSGDYPWSASVAPQDNYAGANAGQVKYLFSFDLTYSGDGDDLPDWWELHYFGNTGFVESSNPDDDSYTNAQELALGSDPTVDGGDELDIDADGLLDSTESGLGKIIGLRDHPDPGLILVVTY